MNKTPFQGDKKTEIVLSSIVPDFLVAGHNFHYHKSVGEAAASLGWKHVVAIPPKLEKADLPPEWEPCLDIKGPDPNDTFFDKVLKANDTLKLAIMIAKFLKKNALLESKHCIIFLESFARLQLFSLAFSLFLIPKDTVSVWLLYRFDVHHFKYRFVYKILNQIIKWRLGSKKFKFLTDSELLKVSLSNYFNESFHIMPIPHADLGGSIPNLRKIKSPEILCWWPGSPRPEKGLRAIQLLTNFSSESSKKLCIIAASSSGLILKPGGAKILLIADELTSSEYLEWLHTCDIVLLPYDPIVYSERTSGIFTESIVVGKIPFVSPNTWMASELLKYGLERLIVNWQAPEKIVSKILELSIDNSTLQPELSKMRQIYCDFHSIQGYASAMSCLHRSLNSDASGALKSQS